MNSSKHSSKGLNDSTYRSQRSRKYSYTTKSTKNIVELKEEPKTEAQMLADENDDGISAFYKKLENATKRVNEFVETFNLHKILSTYPNSRKKSVTIMLDRPSNEPTFMDELNTYANTSAIDQMLDKINKKRLQREQLQKKIQECKDTERLKHLKSVLKRRLKNEI